MLPKAFATPITSVRRQHTVPLERPGAMGAAVGVRTGEHGMFEFGGVGVRRGSRDHGSRSDGDRLGQLAGS